MEVEQKFGMGIHLDRASLLCHPSHEQGMDATELRAVLAHEVAHIVNDDIRAVTVAVATAGLVALLADVVIRATVYGGRRRSGGRNDGGAQAVLMIVGFVAVLLAPLAAQLIRFAVSRQREYLADATAAQMLRDPQSMVDALRRLEEDPTPLTRFESANAHLWFEEPNDLKGRGQAASLARRFATHPTLEQRIDRLAQRRVGDLDADDPLPQQPRDEAAAQDFDLGELGHRSIVAPGIRPTRRHLSQSVDRAPRLNEPAATDRRGGSRAPPGRPAAAGFPP